MAAIWMRARGELRSRLGSILALALIVGVIGGVVIAAASGARRTDTSYDRFVVATGSPHAAVVTRNADLPGIIERIRRLPQVADAAVITSPIVIPTTAGGRLLFEGGVNAFWGPFEHRNAQWLQPMLVAGRLPDPDRADEVAVGYNPTPQVRLGAHIRLKVIRPEAADPGGTLEFEPGDLAADVPAKVVGVVLMVTGLEARSEGEVFLTPAFQRAYAGAKTQRMGFVRLTSGTNAAALGAAVARITPAAQVVEFGGEGDRVRRQTDPQAISMWLFAGLAGVVGALIFGQAMARQTLLESTENPILRTVGMTPRQLVGVAILRAAVVGLVGAGLAIVVGIALSPLVPFGLARFVEPDPGLSLDGGVLAVGALAIAGLAVLVSLPAAFRAARVRGDALGLAEIGPGRPSAIATVVARRGVPPPAAMGVRMALEPGRGRSASPVRSTAASVILALSGLTLAFGFGASLDHLFNTPRLYGADWDLVLHAWTSPDAADVWTPPLRGEPTVAEFSTGSVLGGQVVVRRPGGRGVQTAAWGLDAAQGAVHPTVIDGRWPRSDTEIALGTNTLQAIDADVGDSVRAAAGRRNFTLHVVGRVVFPEITPGPAGVGNGAGLTFHGLRRLVPRLPASDALIRLTEESDLRDVGRHFQRYQGVPSLAAGTGLFSGLDELHHAEAVPVVLGGILALAAILALGHMLVTSVRRRRHDLSILVTLGFLRRQVSATVAWQATTLALVALAVGVPIGVIAARWTWTLFAEHVGVVPESVIALRTLAVAALATVVVANMIAIVPGRIAARLRPAVVLRSE